MNIISPKTMWVIIVLGGILSFLTLDHDVLYLPTVYTEAFFIITVLVWASLLGSAFFVHREAYKNSYATTKVVREGIYKTLKHPMYVGDIILFLGIGVLFPSYWVLAFVSFSVVIFLWFMKIETHVIEERFGSLPQAEKVETAARSVRRTETKSRATTPRVSKKPKVVRKPRTKKNSEE